MVKVLSYGLGFCLLLVLLGMYVLFRGPDAWDGRRNLKNSYLVYAGMSMREARTIMGPEGRKSIHQGCVVYSYDPQPMAADLISVFVGTDSLVIGVNHGD